MAYKNRGQRLCNQAPKIGPSIQEQIIRSAQASSTCSFHASRGPCRGGSALPRQKPFVHLAGLKSPGAAFANPPRYDNVRATLSLIETTIACDIHTLAFSFSTAVSNDPQSLQLGEAHPPSATNPYIRINPIVAMMLSDVAPADPDGRMAVLRHRKPVRARVSRKRVVSEVDWQHRIPRCSRPAHRCWRARISPQPARYGEIHSKPNAILRALRPRSSP